MSYRLVWIEVRSKEPGYRLDIYQFDCKQKSMYIRIKNILIVYEQEAGGKTRKYYSLTKQGRTLLEKKTEEWKEYSAAVSSVLALEV